MIKTIIISEDPRLKICIATKGGWLQICGDEFEDQEGIAVVYFDDLDKLIEVLQKIQKDIIFIKGLNENGAIL